MGLFIREPGEAIFCGFCNKSIRGPKFLITKTASGKAICSKCLDSLHLIDILSKLDTMPDDEIDLFIETMEENAEKQQQFNSTLTFPGFKFSVDPVHHWVRFDNFHYIFDVSDFIAIVHGLIIDSGTAKGELQFYTINPYYPFRNVKVKVSLKGFLQSTQMKNLAETLNAISVAFGDTPVLTPKEFKKLHKQLLLEKEAEIMDDLELLLDVSPESVADPQE